MSSENPSGADNQQETLLLQARARSALGRGLRRRRRLFLGVRTSGTATQVDWRVASAPRLPRRTSTSGIEQSLEATRRRVRLRTTYVRTGDTTQQRDGRFVSRRSSSTCETRRRPVLRALPTANRRSETTSRSFAAHRAVDADEGAPDGGRVRTASASSPTTMNFAGKQRSRVWKRSCGILRDCTPGTLANAIAIS